MSTKQCNLCGSKYDQRIEFCFRDGMELLSADQITDQSLSATDSKSLSPIDLGELTENISIGSIGDKLEITGSSIQSNNSIDLLSIDDIDEDIGFFNNDEIDFDDSLQLEDKLIYNKVIDYMETHLIESNL